MSVERGNQVRRAGGCPLVGLGVLAWTVSYSMAAAVLPAGGPWRLLVRFSSGGIVVPVLLHSSANAILQLGRHL